MSMATGEYVSVSSQADTEKAALEEEKIELAENFSGKHAELTVIYVRRGLPHALASEVADKLMTHDAIGAHARDEFGITAATAARSLQAAIYSAVSFAIGAALPLGVAAIAPTALIIPFVAIAALISLAILGGLASKTGGRPHATWRSTSDVLERAGHGSHIGHRLAFFRCRLVLTSEATFARTPHHG